MEENVFPRFGRVAIVDDKIEEVRKLQNILAKRGVPYIFYDYNDISNEEIYKVDSIRLLFLDIRLQSGTTDYKNIFTVLASTVEKIVPRENGPYAIILWTNEFYLKEKIINYLNRNLDDSETTKPLYIGAIDKQLFLKKPLDNLENELIKCYESQNMLSFLMEVENNVMTVPVNVVKKISYSFVQNGNNEELKELFLRFARTETCDSPKNATKIVLRLLSDLIRDQYMEITSNDTMVDKLSELWQVDFTDDQELPKANAEQSAIINTVLNVNTHSESTDRVPGKVYRQTDEKIGIDKDTLAKSTFMNNGSFNPSYKKTPISTELETIEIDITPSCDYAQGKNHMLRTLYGYIVYINETVDEAICKKIDKIKAEVFKEYVYVSPIFKINERICLLLLNTKMMALEKKNFSEGLVYLFRLNDEITNEIRKKTGEIISRIGINRVD